MDSDFRKKFYSQFEDFCKQKYIIAEFIRFHPLLNNHEFARGYLNVIYNRQTVYINLIKSYNEVYGDYQPTVRGNILKAKENVLQVCIYQNEFPIKKEFDQMYYKTMNRVNAVKYSYFSDVMKN